MAKGTTTSTTIRALIGRRKPKMAKRGGRKKPKKKKGKM